MIFSIEFYNTINVTIEFEAGYFPDWEGTCRATLSRRGTAHTRKHGLQPTWAMDASLGLNLVVEPKQKKRKLNARVETEMDSYRTYKLSIHDYSLHILKNCNAESLKRYKEAIGQDVFEALVMAKMNMSKLNI